MAGERHGGMSGLQKEGRCGPAGLRQRRDGTMILNGPGISYTEPDIGSEFVPPLPEHPREAIVKLCEHCTNRLLHRDDNTFDNKKAAVLAETLDVANGKT